MHRLRVTNFLEAMNGPRVTFLSRVEEVPPIGNQIKVNYCGCDNGGGGGGGGVRVEVAGRSTGIGYCGE